MTARSFRAFAAPEDLKRIFSAFQGEREVCYYPCGRGTVLRGVRDITEEAGFGVNRRGSHINFRWLVCPAERPPRKQWVHGVKGAFFLDQMENPASIVVDIGGVYQDMALFPTEVSTIWWENSAARDLYQALRRACRGECPGSREGCLIGRDTCRQWERWRFCPINFSSPAGYDLKIEPDFWKRENEKPLPERREEW